jgi:chorismate lyase
LTVKSFLFVREPLWREHRKGMHHDLPEDVQSWVYESGSLTQRLRDYYGEVKVKILFHDWRNPYLGEHKLLNMPWRRYGLIREVLLHTGGKPLLLARTVIPELTIKAAHRNLAHLGTRPLGEVIFSYPDLERICMDMALIPRCAWTPAANANADIREPVWGRRTVYAIQNRPMVVSEFFLPEILDH